MRFQLSRSFLNDVCSEWVLIFIALRASIPLLDLQAAAPR